MFKLLFASIAWLLLNLTVLGANHAFALSFEVHQNNNKNLLAILARGPLETGDTEKLESFVRNQPRKPNTAIYLASPGGSLYEGMKLGRYFKNYKIKTVVEGGEICASACAIAFLGGHDRNGWPWRSGSDNSKLGFHAFSAGGELSESDTQRVSQMYLHTHRRSKLRLNLWSLILLRGTTAFIGCHKQKCARLGLRSGATQQMVSFADRRVLNRRVFQ